MRLGVTLSPIEILLNIRITSRDDVVAQAVSGSETVVSPDEMLFMLCYMSCLGALLP